MVPKAKIGDSLKVHYTGTLDNGEVFDSSRNSDPLEFKIGAGSLIPGFENAVIGMAMGEVKKVTIPASEAYGDHDPGKTIEIKRADLPEGFSPKIGDRLVKSDDCGCCGTPLVVTNVSEKHITVDANHPLAGKDLTFEIELVEIS